MESNRKVSFDNELFLKNLIDLPLETLISNLKNPRSEKIKNEFKNLPLLKNYCLKNKIVLSKKYHNEYLITLLEGHYFYLESEKKVTEIESYRTKSIEDKFSLICNLIDQRSQELEKAIKNKNYYALCLKAAGFIGQLIEDDHPLDKFYEVLQQAEKDMGEIIDEFGDIGKLTYAGICCEFIEQLFIKSHRGGFKEVNEIKAVFSYINNSGTGKEELEKSLSNTVMEIISLTLNKAELMIKQFEEDQAFLDNYTLKIAPESLRMLECFSQQKENDLKTVIDLLTNKIQFLKQEFGIVDYTHTRKNIK